MKVLLVGKGAREHAIALKLSRSPLLSKLYLWPGHAAMAPLGECLDVPPADFSTPEKSTVLFSALSKHVKNLAIDLVVCGPEGPLDAGLADFFGALGVPVFGPRKKAAALESSKSFAKDVMQAAQIPTAAFTVVRSEATCRSVAMNMLQEKGGVVLKASGLAAGKGVFVCFDKEAVEAGLRHLYHTSMKDAARSVVVEEVLRGRECSYFTFIGESGSTGLGFAVDFKRLGDGDTGPNTGGMGCYAPVPWLPKDAGERVERLVVEPLLRELKNRGIKYCGCLYVGLMWPDGARDPAVNPAVNPAVVEFNVRLGDPEAQVLAAYDDRDWLALILSKVDLPVTQSQLAASTVSLVNGVNCEPAVAVVMASASYPFGDPAGERDGLFLDQEFFEARSNRHGKVQVFAASIKGDKAPFKPGSGRVLTVTGRGRDFAKARAAAYEVVEELSLSWPGCQWRRDIAGRKADATGVIS